MNKNKHLTLDDRYTIQHSLEERVSNLSTLFLENNSSKHLPYNMTGNAGMEQILILSI